MKSKLFISLVLALIMLFALAAPVLARPARGYMVCQEQVIDSTTDNGTVKFTLQVTHENQVKVTFVMDGALPNYDAYYGQIQVQSYGGFFQLYPRKATSFTTFSTDGDGDARFTGFTNYGAGFNTGDRDVVISIKSDETGNTHYTVTVPDVPFK